MAHFGKEGKGKAKAARCMAMYTETTQRLLFALSFSFRFFFLYFSFKSYVLASVAYQGWDGSIHTRMALGERDRWSFEEL